MAAHRHWRLFFYAYTFIGNSVCITELALASSAGGPSLCLGGTATSSENSPSVSYGPAKAIDGLFTDYNYWAAKGAPLSAGNARMCWLQVDLGSAEDIVEMRITFPQLGEGVGNAPNFFSLYHSDDGKNFTYVRSWRDQTFVAGETKVYAVSATPSAEITNKVLTRFGALKNAAGLPVGPFYSATRYFGPVRLVNQLPMLRTQFSGTKRIAGSTTSLGQPLSRQVDLVHQKTGILVKRVVTPDSGEFEFEGLAEETYMLIGTDISGEQNSVVFAHLSPVD